MCTRCPFVARGQRNMERHILAGCLDATVPDTNTDLSVCKDVQEDLKNILEILHDQKETSNKIISDQQAELEQLEHSLTQCTITETLNKDKLSMEGLRDKENLEHKINILCLEKENLKLKNQSARRSRVFSKSFYRMCENPSKRKTKKSTRTGIQNEIQSGQIGQDTQKILLSTTPTCNPVTSVDTTTQTETEDPEKKMSKLACKKPGKTNSSCLTELKNTIKSLEEKNKKLEALVHQLTADVALKTGEISDKEFSLLELKGQMEALSQELEKTKEGSSDHITQLEAQLSFLSEELDSFRQSSEKEQGKSRGMENSILSDKTESSEEWELTTSGQLSLEEKDQLEHLDHLDHLDSSCDNQKNIQCTFRNSFMEGCDMIIKHLMELKKNSQRVEVIPEEQYFQLENQKFYELDISQLDSSKLIQGTEPGNVYGRDPFYTRDQFSPRKTDSPVEAIPWPVEKCKDLYKTRHSILCQVETKFAELLESMMNTNVYQSSLKKFVLFRASNMCKIPYKEYVKMLRKQVTSMKNFLVNIKKADPQREESIMQKFLTVLDTKLIQYGEYYKSALDPLYVGHLEQSCRIQACTVREDKLCYDSLVGNMDSFFLATASLQTILRTYLGLHSPISRTVVYVPINGETEHTFYELGGTHKGIRYWVMMNRLVSFAQCLKTILSGCLCRLFRQLCENQPSLLQDPAGHSGHNAQIIYTPGFFQMNDLRQTACKQLCRNCLNLYDQPKFLRLLSDIIREYPFYPSDKDLFDTFEDTSGGRLEYRRWMDSSIEEEEKEAIIGLFDFISPMDMDSCLEEIKSDQ